MDNSKETPVLFLVFNRPDCTAKVFEALRLHKPKKLFIAADGFRLNKEGEKELCDEVRQIVVNIDWECELRTLFRDNNLGCGKAVSSAINWFFEFVEEGIILEDDCLPSQSFFKYCSELLEKYKYNEDIYTISGNNFHGKSWSDDSYYFSAYSHIWGWATWKRAWAKYDFNLHSMNDAQLYENLKHYFNRKLIVNYWFSNYKSMKYNPIDTWDYQWMFLVWYNKGVNILPNINLVQNIGFDENATHTTSSVHHLSNITSKEIEAIIHPSFLKINSIADEKTSSNVFRITSSNYMKIKNNLLNLLRKYRICFN